MSTEEKTETRGRKPKEAKAKEDAELKAEQEVKAKIGLSDLKSKLDRDLKERTYVPKKGTGKHFHIAIEIPVFNGGKRVSSMSVVPQEYKTAIQTITNASRLGYSIGFFHDPCAFHSESENENMLDAIQDYVETSNMDVLDHSSDHLANEDNNINNTLKKLIAQKTKYIEDQEKAAKKKSSYLDRTK